MARRDFTTTVEHIHRVWIEETGECYEVKPDDDGLDLVQINYYSGGVRGKEPDTTMLMMPEVAEELVWALRSAAMDARALQKKMEEESKNG